MALRTFLVRFVPCGVGVAIAGSAFCTPIPYVVSMGGSIIEVDVPPNTETAYGATTFATESLGLSATGRLYSVNAAGFMYDVTNPVPILKGVVAAGMVGDLDADAFGLWAYDNAADVLFYYDEGTSVVTYYAPVSGLTGADIHGVAYDPSTGSVFLSDVNNVLYRIVTPFVPVAVPIGTMAHLDSGHISDIDFDPVTGDLYAMTWANRHFYKVNKLSALTSFVSGPGTGTLDSTGMAMPVVPEPATLVALGGGLILALSRKNERKAQGRTRI